METRFFYDLEQKHLCFNVKQRVTADPDVQFKATGLFNTVSGNLGYRAHVKKYLPLGKSSAGMGSQPLTLGAGLAVASSSAATASWSKAKPLLTASVWKRAPVFERSQNTLVTARGTADFDPSSQRLAKSAKLRLSHRMMNFTRRQDLQVKAGLDVDLNGPKPAAAPYLQLRENNWALNMRGKRWFVTYDL